MPDEWEIEFDDLFNSGESETMKGERVENPYLEYVIYKLLQEFDLKYMSKIRFYKLLYLAYKYLKEKGVDIKLPYFWYEFGPLVDVYALPLDIKFYNDGSKNVPMLVSEPLTTLTTIKEDVKNLIDNIIYLIKLKFEKKSSDDLIDEVYKYAPLEVQRSFRALLKRRLSDMDADTINTLLTNIVQEFPREYNELYTVLLRIVPLVRKGVRDRIMLNELEDLLRSFWRTFCQKLCSEYNENLPNGLIRMEEKYKDSLILLKKKLREIEQNLLNSFNNKYEEFNPIFEKYLEDFLKSKGYI